MDVYSIGKKYSLVLDGSTDGQMDGAQIIIPIKKNLVGDNTADNNISWHQLKGYTNVFIILVKFVSVAIEF